jgi:putative two-component system response regulator
MPRMDGYAALERIRELSKGYLPVLVFTADSTQESRKRALGLGASDYLTKPADVDEICLRVQNYLESRALYLTGERHRKALEERMRDRTRELYESQVEILTRLAMVGEYRDDETGDHNRRVADMAGRIATAAGLAPDQVSLIHYGSLLHDIGKVAIPDSILQKTRPLSNEEYEIVKSHVEVGARILENSKSRLLQVAHTIALTHHERWDGTGYPARLIGDLIPIEGRIVAIADGYDAMLSRRPYKRPMSPREAVAEIVSKSGVQFDPNLVATFVTLISPELAVAA